MPSAKVMIHATSLQCRPAEVNPTSAAGWRLASAHGVRSGMAHSPGEERGRAYVPFRLERAVKPVAYRMIKVGEP